MSPKNGVRFEPYWPFVIVRKWRPKDNPIKGGSIIIPESAKDRMHYPHGTLVAVFGECPLDGQSDVWIHPKIKCLIGKPQEEVEKAEIHVFYGSYVGEQLNSGAMAGRLDDELYDVVKVDQIFGEVVGEIW